MVSNKVKWFQIKLNVSFETLNIISELFETGLFFSAGEKFFADDFFLKSSYIQRLQSKYHLMLLKSNYLLNN